VNQNNQEATKLVNLSVDVCVASDLHFFFPIKLIDGDFDRLFTRDIAILVAFQALDGNQLLMSCRMYSGAVGTCGECTRGGIMHCCSCHRHRTMAADAEDIRHEASSLPHVLIL